MIKKKLNKVQIFKWSLVVVMILILIFIAPKFRQYLAEKEFENRPTETAYCHFKSETSTFGVNRTECINMKLVSKDMNRINLSQFNSLNYTSFFCTKYINDIPDCRTENHYLSAYPLTLWTNSSINGYACIEYQVNFTVDDRESIMEYLAAFMQFSYDNQSEQRKAFIDCEGRI